MNILDTATKQESALIFRWLEAIFPRPTGYEERQYRKQSTVGTLSSLALSRVSKGEAERLNPKRLHDIAFSFETYPPRMTAAALGV